MGRNETDLSKEIDKALIVELPKGFHIELANKFNAFRRAQAHGRAVSNELSEIPRCMNERTRAYTGTVKSPDYNEYLDLCIEDENGTD